MNITVDDDEIRGLYFLIYTSYAVSRDESELTVLLQRIRENNKTQGITGMLLYLNGIFIQLIEGAPLSVISLYHKIYEDARHKEVALLKWGLIKKRYFQDWSMAFKAISAQELAGEESYRCLNALDPQNTASVLKVFELLSIK